MANIWDLYKSTIHKNCTGAATARNSVNYWKDRLFSASVTYLIPLSLVTLIPGIYLAIKLELWGMLAADFITMAIIIGVALLPNLSVYIRKILFNAALYFIAFVMLHYLGSNGPGMIYLLAVTVFVVLSMDRLYGYIFLGLNILTCAFFALAIHYQFASTILLAEYQVDTWIGVSTNLIFLSGVAVFLIPHLYKGLQSAFDEQKKLRKELEQSVDAIKLREQKFKALVQEGSDLIAILDEEANYTYVAPTAEAVLGIDADEFIGNSALDYIHTDDQERIKKVLSAISNKEVAKISPFRFRDANGNWRWIETIITNMLDNPAVEGFVANSRDVTERIEREQKLQESLELYEYVTHATEDIIYDWDIEQDKLHWDDSFHDKFIYDIEDGDYNISYWAENVHPDDLQETKNSLNKSLNNHSQSKWEEEYRFQKKDGSYATVFERGFIIRDDKGNAIRMIGSLQDITERKQYESKLEELSLVASKTTDIIIMTDADDRITWVNDAFEKLTGYTYEESIGKNPGKLLQGPDTNPEPVKRMHKAVQNQQSVQEVILNYTKKGESYWLDITIDPIFERDGSCKGFIAVEKDVSRQIEREQELRKSLQEKETLLMEIHHRVKNNLAVVSGLMQLQAFDEEDAKVKQRLLNGVSRIQTMGTIHELLYQSKSFTKLNFQETVTKLITQIVDTFGPEIELDTQFNLEQVHLNINQALPASLIVNEVVTNVLKHAFEKQDKGTLTITLSGNEETIDLKIKDNGKGLPKNFAHLKSGESLGLKLIDTLSKQLKAEYNYHSNDNNGTQFHLQFEKADIKGIGSAHL